MLRRKRRTARQNAWRQWKARQRGERLRSAVKRSKDRHEDAVIAKVRAACVERDGRCRLGRDAEMRTRCRGVSQWAHLDENRRFKTRGMEPERRHTTEMTMMMCEAHHTAYDRYKFDLVFHSEDYANGTFSVVYRDQQAAEL